MSLERSILVRFGSSNVFLTSSKACCVTFSSLSIACDLKFKKWNDRRTNVYNNSVSSKLWKNHGNVSSPRSLSSFIVLLLFMYHDNGESADNNTLQYYSNISFSCPNWHQFTKCFKQNNRIIGQIRPSTRGYEYKKNNKNQFSISEDFTGHSSISCVSFSLVGVCSLTLTKSSWSFTNWSVSWFSSWISISISFWTSTTAWLRFCFVLFKKGRPRFDCSSCWSYIHPSRSITLYLFDITRTMIIGVIVQIGWRLKVSLVIYSFPFLHTFICGLWKRSTSFPTYQKPKDLVGLNSTRKRSVRTSLSVQMILLRYTSKLFWSSWW